MDKIQQEIVEWSKKALPLATLESQILKFNEELEELKRATTQQSFIEELCDCYIVALGVIRFEPAGEALSKLLLEVTRRVVLEKEEKFYDLPDRFEIVEKIAWKLKVNKKRKWKIVNGVYKHIDN